jgi:hypothetical protein
VFTVKEMALWRMALHRDTPEGEIDNATRLLIQILRKRNFTAEMLNGVTVKSEPKQPEPKPKPKKAKLDPGEVVIPFGKHKGQRVNQVPPNYLQWIHDWIDNGDPDLQKRFGWLKETILEYWNG